MLSGPSCGAQCLHAWPWFNTQRVLQEGCRNRCSVRPGSPGHMSHPPLSDPHSCFRNHWCYDLGTRSGTKAVILAEGFPRGTDPQGEVTRCQPRPCHCCCPLSTGSNSPSVGGSAASTGTHQQRKTKRNSTWSLGKQAPEPQPAPRMRSLTSGLQVRGTLFPVCVVPPV